MSSDYYTHPMQYPHMAPFHVPHSQQMPQGNYSTGAGYGAYHDPSYAQTAMQARGYPVQQAQQSGSWFNFSNDRFIKGLLIGAAATYLLTNESVSAPPSRAWSRAGPWSRVRSKRLKNAFTTPKQKSTQPSRRRRNDPVGLGDGPDSRLWPLIAVLETQPASLVQGVSPSSPRRFNFAGATGSSLPTVGRPCS